MSELLSTFGSLGADDVHAMAEPLLLESTEELLRARNVLDAEITRRLQAMDIRDVSLDETGRAMRVWLVEEQFLAGPDAGRRLRLARRSPFRPVMMDAFKTGDISLAHASVILRALDGLPEDVRDTAEQELTEAARWCDPDSLARACHELRIRLGADEDAEAASQRKFASRWATVSSTFEGMLHLEAMLDPEAAATLTAALAPLLVRTGAEDERTTGQRRADALTDLARRALNTGELPDHGGDRPHVVVTVPLAELRDGLQAGQLGLASINGWAVGPETARRLACDAGIIPALLGSDSEVLDLGRSTPSWSRAQRRARALEDKGCAFPKCQASLDRCELHHDQHWSHGGKTDYINGIYLCYFHHWLTHHGKWQITRNRLTARIEIRRT